jgi:molybdopterin-guanine dinucleotide biosynthesis protein MobB
MLISSSRRTVIMIDHETEQEPQLDQLLKQIAADTVDMVLVEGFKQWPFAKIELHREATGKPMLHPTDPNIIAVAHDLDTPLDNISLPQLDLNNIQAITDFIIDYKNRTAES